ncbi:hypothetical protein GCM10022415_00300 [Knoellia locipacati]|uniref:Uncharacterized protein n=1 Tax=Knoellia locipacati TaxID=882824 RepID=A0A512SVK6_9MICO|nr:hypothetical protein [Knoellia locipacati]GEQ11983.1 hypothetical protein KLO01_00300 [Knoellia locipacati]
MGDVKFQVVPADMDADATQWGAASEALGRAHQAVPALGVSFGGFQSVVGARYSAADLAVRNMLEVGESRLRATSTNVTSNTTRTKDSDKDADTRVRTAGGGGGGGGGGGTGAGGDGGASGGDHGGKGSNHYAELMGTGTGAGHPMPTDPKDPDITFDRTVDPETGDVTWTPRDMEPGEGRAVDGRDVERIPARADRIVVTMVDGEPRITYVDEDADTGGPGVQWQSEGGRPVASAQLVEPGAPSQERVVAGSGAVEPTAEPARTEWSQALPEGADYAVVEVRDGEPHLVFLDVEGSEVTEVSDDRLPSGRVRAEVNGVSR